MGAVLLLSACGGDDSDPMDDVSAATAAPTSEPMDTPAAEPGDGAGTVADEDAADQETPEEEPSEEESVELAAGTYRDYDRSAVADPGYSTTVLFFHASWCPECRAFEQSIEAGPIPDGVQILKVDYDTSDELKRRYGVTIQTTFVKVDTDGEQLSSWVGYHQDRSIETILDELG